MKNKKKYVGHGAGGAVYGLGFLGSLVYFIQHATSFGGVLFGVLKALLWPAFLLYKIAELLKF